MSTDLAFPLLGTRLANKARLRRTPGFDVHPANRAIRTPFCPPPPPTHIGGPFASAQSHPVRLDASVRTDVRVPLQHRHLALGPSSAPGSLCDVSVAQCTCHQPKGAAQRAGAGGGWV